AAGWRRARPFSLVPGCERRYNRGGWGPRPHGHKRAVIVNPLLKRVWPWVPWVLMFFAFPVVGFIAGWVAGFSRAPVVGTPIPVVLGLLGALTYGLLDRTVKAGNLLARLKQELDAAAFEKARAAIREESNTSLWLPAFWATGVMFFAVFCYLGLGAG